MVARIRAGNLAGATELLRELLTADPRAADLQHELASLMLRRGDLGAEGLDAARQAFAADEGTQHASTLLRHLIARDRCAEARELLADPRLATLAAETLAELQDPLAAACGPPPGSRQ